MPDNSFSEDIFPHVQSKPALVQLEVVSSHPTTGYQGKETDTHLAQISFQGVVERSGLPSPSFSSD